MTASSLATPLGPLNAEQNAQFYRRLADFERRVVRDGAVPFAQAMSGMQMLAENTYVPPAEFIPNFMTGLILRGNSERRGLFWECARLGYCREEFEKNFAPEWPKFDVSVRDFVTFTVAELGHRKGCQWTTAFRAGVRYGFELCPPMAALVVRKVYDWQPLGEKIIVAMPGVRYGGHADHVFVIEHGEYGKTISVVQAPFYGELNDDSTPDRMHLRGDDVVMFARRQKG